MLANNLVLACVQPEKLHGERQNFSPFTARNFSSSRLKDANNAFVAFLPSEQVSVTVSLRLGVTVGSVNECINGRRSRATGNSRWNVAAIKDDC